MVNGANIYTALAQRTCAAERYSARSSKGNVFCENRGNPFVRSDGKAYNMRFGEDCLWGGARIRLTQFPANIPIRVHIDYAFMGFMFLYINIC